MKPTIVLPLALVLALLLAVPVYADKPIVTTGDWDITWLVTDPPPCPGIDVWDRSVTTYRETSFFDNQDNLLRKETHMQGTDTLFSPQNPGVELTGPFSTISRYDALTGEEHLNGTGWHINVPGRGVVFLAAGHMFPDGRFVGRSSWLEPDGWAEVCALLRGD
jgi:hypothetical protein